MNDLDSDYESYPAHMRIPHEDILALYAELTMNGEYDLLPYEQEWKVRGPLLRRNGYRLRQRYNPDWQPSWEDTNLNPFYCEDSIDSSTPNVMDAVRVSDGLAVAIKATLSWTTEAPIAFLFTDGDAVEEPRNHCVPILDTFIDETEAIVYIVMPLLRAFNDPAFVAVAEVIDFVDQMVQGIEYMHEQNVAHRDITVGNIMMDASELFPEGFHPVRQNLSRNGLTEVVGIMRTHAPVRYYLIDFDAAIAFEKGTPIQLKFAEGKAGRDDEVPEFKTAIRYDPFKVDIFQFGNLLKKEILQKYAGIEFLEPLVREMTRIRPSDRPNAKELRLKFNTVRNRLTAQQIRAHLELKDTSDPLREHLAELGIESLLESESDDSPEQSSSEAATTGRSSHSNESYWSAAHSMDSSITSQSSTEHQQQQQQQAQAQTPQGVFQKVTGMLSRPRSPARTSSSGGTAIPWKPAKLARARSPSPPPFRSAPQPIPQPDSASTSATGSPRSGSRLRTGKFPWSRSSSPDSVSQSPILAVVNHFLSPERLFSNDEDAFENTYQPPVEERMGWSRSTAAPTIAAPSKTSAPPAATRNRRNTVNTAPAPAPAPTPVPVLAPVPPVQPAKPGVSTKPRTGGWNAMESIYNDASAQDYFPYGTERGRQPTVNRAAKSTNALPMASNQPYSTWDSTGYGQSYDQGYDQGMEGQYGEESYDDGGLWASEDALRALNQSPPLSKPSSTKPVEKKEPVVEKKTKPAKSPFSTLTKKSAPTEAVTPTQMSSTSTLRSGVTATKLAAAAASANRKSTIAVEDATSPYNTPPKPTVGLPPFGASVSPPKTSPVTTKIKRTKTKKNSISETPKEKEKEREAPVVSEEAWSMPAIKDDFGTIKTRKRSGSGASTGSRSNSPLAFFGSRSRSGSKVEPRVEAPPPPPKPTSTKPTSFMASAFGWGAKPKPSAPGDLDMDTGAFSFSTPAFVSSLWKAPAAEEPPKPTFSKPATSPQPETPSSDFEMSASPVSTPPPKSGWKAKTSYFPMEPATKPAASSPQEEEDFSNLMASMRMSMAANVEATPKASLKFNDGFEDSRAFQFAAGKAGDDFWSAAMSAFDVDPTSASPEEEKPRSPEPAEVPRFLPKTKTMKAKVAPAPAPAPEPVEVKPAVTKGKKKTTTTKKSSISVESPIPTPAVESPDPWSFMEAPKPEVRSRPIEVTKPVETSKSGYSNWFGTSPDAGEEEDAPETVAAVDLEPASPEPDSWFTAKPKATKAGAKVTKAEPTPAFAVATKATKGKKATKVQEFVEPEPEFEPVPEPEPVVEPKVEETKPEVKEDDDWPEVKPKAKKGKNAKEAAPVNAAPAPVNKWSSFGMDNNDEEDLAATLAADLGEQEQTKPDASAEAEAEKDAEKEAEKEAAANKSNAKPAPAPAAAKNAKGKKKGKR